MSASFATGGSKPWLGHKRMISSGSASFDAYLGGGLTLGSLVLLESDSGSGDLATTIARLFLGQAGPSGHAVSVAAASATEAGDLCSGIPRLAAKARSSPARATTVPVEPHLGSAHQYIGYVRSGGDIPLHERSEAGSGAAAPPSSAFRAAGATASASENAYCSSLDLDRPLTAGEAAIVCRIDQLGVYRSSAHPTLDSLVQQAEELIQGPSAEPAGKPSASPRIRRVVLWGIPEQLRPGEALAWVSRVARACRSSPHACTVLRLPCLHECEARLGRAGAARLLRHGDAVVRLAAFGQEAGGGNAVRAPAGFGAEYSGLARLARLPLTLRMAPARRATAAGAGAGGSGGGGSGTALLLVRRTRRKLELEPMHLPPEGEEARPRQRAGVAAAGASPLAAAVRALRD